MTLLILVVHLFITPACLAQCEGHGYRKCCSGYEWDEGTEDCVKCRPGYFGVDCGQSCEFPSYGDGCQQECKLCTPEECDVSWGCPKKTTTTFYTTKQSVISTPDETYYVTTDSTRYTTTSATTEMHVGNKTSGPRITQQLPISPFDAFFTTQNLLIMAIFGVGLIVITLLLGFTCRIICKKIFSKRQLNRGKIENCPDVAQDEIHYEEIANSSVVPIQGIGYSPLLQNSADVRDVTVGGLNTSEEKEMENLEEIEYRGDKKNQITKSTKNSTNDDPLNRELPTTRELTDSEGYQLPHSSSCGMTGGSIGVSCCVVKETPGDDRSNYLTVLPNSVHHQSELP